MAREQEIDKKLCGLMQETWEPSRACLLISRATGSLLHQGNCRQCVVIGSAGAGVWRLTRLGLTRASHTSDAPAGGRLIAGLPAREAKIGGECSLGLRGVGFTRPGWWHGPKKHP